MANVKKECKKKTSSDNGETIKDLLLLLERRDQNCLNEIFIDLSSSAQWTFIMTLSVCHLTYHLSSR